MTYIESFNDRITIGNPTKVGVLLYGKEVLELDTSTLASFAERISLELKTHPHTMLQYNPFELLQSMREGRFIFCVDQQNRSQLLASGQLWIYDQDPSTGQDIYEFGSWLSFEKGGYGKEILLASQSLIKVINPRAQLIAIVEEQNIRAQNLIEILGGIKIGEKYSTELKKPGGLSAFMYIYDILIQEK